MRILFIALACVLYAQESPAPAKKRPQRIVRPGVSDPAAKRQMTDLKPAAEIPIPGVPDWQVVTKDAVWVSNGPKDTLHRIDAKTNQAIAIEVGKRPCSGLAAGFGSVWVPLCGERGTGAGKGVARVDQKSNKVIATIPAGPWDSEGQIAASKEAVWVVTDKKSVLAKIDPQTNKVVAEVEIAPGSVSPLFYEGFLWVASNETSKLVQVDPKTAKVVREIATGPKPRFLAGGAGSIWTLNQGDGSVSRINAKTGAVEATIEAGIPGGGGEAAFGDGHVWFTVFDFPITKIDAKTNKVVAQWAGPGGDAIRFGHKSIWLSNLRQQNLWRLDLQALR
jgi:DNA-binding beta-propeller fold protein YncE